MLRRKKSKLESFLNFNRYKKRRGAENYEQIFKEIDYTKLKNDIIPGDSPKQFQSYMIKDLNEHMVHLKTGFAGKSELLYYHAQLIVLLRRGADVKSNFLLFDDLWKNESDFLCANLNMRWLIAAADTFIDHDADAITSALMLNAVILINTIKLYETERYLYNIESKQSKDYDLEKLDPISKNCFDLFDELPSFRVGVDDTLRNMRWRIEAIAQSRPLAHQLLLEVFDRVNKHDSVYKRFRECHQKPRTAWWSG